MDMATNEGQETMHFATSTTATDFACTEPIKQLVVVNQDATNAVSVTVATGRTQTAAEGQVTTAVAAADETFHVAPGASVTVFKSPRETYVAGSVIAAAGTPTVSLHGTPWYD